MNAKPSYPVAIAFVASLLASLMFGLWQHSPIAGVFMLFALQVPIHLSFAKSP